MEKVITAQYLVDEFGYKKSTAADAIAKTKNALGKPAKGGILLVSEFLEYHKIKPKNMPEQSTTRKIGQDAALSVLLQKSNKISVTLRLNVGVNYRVSYLLGGGVATVLGTFAGFTSGLSGAAGLTAIFAVPDPREDEKPIYLVYDEKGNVRTNDYKVESSSIIGYVKMILPVKTIGIPVCNIVDVA